MHKNLCTTASFGKWSIGIGGSNPPHGTNLLTNYNMEQSRKNLYTRITSELCNLDEGSLKDMLKYIGKLKMDQKIKDSTLVYLEKYREKNPKKQKRKRIVKLSPSQEVVIAESKAVPSMEGLRDFAKEYL